MERAHPPQARFWAEWGGERVYGVEHELPSRLVDATSLVIFAAPDRPSRVFIDGLVEASSRSSSPFGIAFANLLLDRPGELFAHVQSGAWGDAARRVVDAAGVIDLRHPVAPPLVRFWISGAVGHRSFLSFRKVVTGVGGVEEEVEEEEEEVEEDAESRVCWRRIYRYRLSGGTMCADTMDRVAWSPVSELARSLAATTESTSATESTSVIAPASPASPATVSCGCSIRRPLLLIYVRASDAADVEKQKRVERDNARASVAFLLEHVVDLDLSGVDVLVAFAHASSCRSEHLPEPRFYRERHEVRGLINDDFARSVVDAHTRQRILDEQAAVAENFMTGDELLRWARAGRPHGVFFVPESTRLNETDLRDVLEDMAGMTGSFEKIAKYTLASQRSPNASFCLLAPTTIRCTHACERRMWTRCQRWKGPRADETFHSGERRRHGSKGLHAREHSMAVGGGRWCLFQAVSRNPRSSFEALVVCCFQKSFLLFPKITPMSFSGPMHSQYDCAQPPFPPRAFLFARGLL